MCGESPQAGREDGGADLEALSVLSLGPRTCFSPTQDRSPPRTQRLDAAGAIGVYRLDVSVGSRGRAPRLPAHPTEGLLEDTALLFAGFSFYSRPSKGRGRVAVVGMRYRTTNLHPTHNYLSCSEMNFGKRLVPNLI